MEYLDEVNRFLRERTVGTWRPEQRENSAYAARLKLSDNTLDAYSRDLENFWTFIEARKICWQTLSYQQLLDTYDTAMARGCWSEDGKPLSPSTINRRVDLAVQFLQWAAQRALREAFNVAAGVRSTISRKVGHQRQVVEVRIGRRRVEPVHLRLPTAAEISRWLAEVKVRRGPTKALACRMISKPGCDLRRLFCYARTNFRIPARWHPADLRAWRSATAQKAPASQAILRKPGSAACYGLRFHFSMNFPATLPYEGPNH